MPNCYCCDRQVAIQDELSPRGRCVRCEYQRSKANEEENDELRAALAAHGRPDLITLPRYRPCTDGTMTADAQGEFIKLSDVPWHIS